MNDTIEDYVDSDAAAAHLGLSVATVQQWARTGKIPAARPGKRWLFKLTEVDTFISRPRDAWQQSAQSRGRRRAS